MEEERREGGESEGGWRKRGRREGEGREEGGRVVILTNMLHPSIPLHNSPTMPTTNLFIHPTHNAHHLPHLPGP